MKAVVLKILILGGTQFLGLHLTEELQERGHEVTLFNRGLQNQDVFPNIEKLQGDRDGNLHALAGRRWDAVIDTSGHLPRIVEQSAQVLAGATNHYTFISTIGVYENFHQFNIDETYPIAQLEDQKNEEITDQSYGALKGLCENVIQQYFPKQALIIRPGLIVGPSDPTDRFTYWPRRVAAGGEILAPASQLVQIIDVRDLAKWIVQMVEKQVTGIYNATGETLSFEQLLLSCEQASNQKTDVTWVSEEFLLQKGVQDWTELPLWLSSNRQMPGFFHINSQKAIKSGLTFRPLAETSKATLNWDQSREDVKDPLGLDSIKEKKLLLDWKNEPQKEIGPMIHQVLQEANQTFFLPNSMRLDLLKNYPQVIPILAEWLYNEWHPYDSSLTEKKLIHSLVMRLNNDRIPVTFVVLKDSAPIGMISLKDLSDPEFSDFPKDSIWMGSLQVVPEERNKGLGEELLKFAATAAKRLGQKKLYFYTSNPINVAWYCKRGAQVIEERPFRNHKVTIMFISLQ